MEKAKLRGTYGMCVLVVLMLSHSVMSDSVTPWTVARQAPLSIGFLRQEYWNGLPFPFPGDLPNPAIEFGPSAQVDSSLLSHQRNPQGITEKGKEEIKLFG